MAAFKKAFSNRPFVGAVLFVVFLYFLEELFFGFPQVKLLQLALGYFSKEAKLIILISSIVSFIIFYFFVFVALKSSIEFQALYTFLLGIASLVQYGYWKAVEHFLSLTDLRIVAATPINTWTGASVLFFDWHFILPVIGFVSTLLLFSERQSAIRSLIKFTSLFLAVMILNLSYMFTDQTLNLGLSLSSFYQTIARFAIDSMLPGQREALCYQHTGTPQNNILLVIDESIRGDHLGINGYERDTTPFLNQFANMETGFHNFGLAVSDATCSYPSNALILTGVRPGFDEFKKSAKYPTVFQYAKAMGYKTFYIDVQANSFWNGLTDRDIPFIDSWFKARDFGNDYESDFRAADKIVEILSKDSGNFIVLNKRGVHFLYESSYPEDAAVWLPLPADYISHPELISNSYDNGLLYNINTFFERLLVNHNVLENTTILYTSDHGQTLFESHVSWLHCNYTAQEATVPLILMGKNLPPLNEEYPASHTNILPTLLDLMGVSAEERVHFYAPSLFSETASDTGVDRFFFDGSLRLIDFPDP